MQKILPALSSPKGLLLFVIAIAAFLRLGNLSTVPPGLYPDEAMNGNNALEALETHDWKVFYPENNGREGLFVNIQSISLAAFGNEPWALRLPSAIFGIFTVLGTYFLTRELFKNGYEIQKEHGSTKDRNKKGSYIRNSFVFRKEAIALLAAFLLATSFWHINFSRIGFRAIMAPAFLTWGVYFLLLSLNRIGAAVSKLGHSSLIRNSNFKIRNLWLLPTLAGAIYGLGMHSYIAYRATPLLIILIIAAYWLKNKDGVVRRKILLSTFYFLLSTIIVFLPLGVFFLDNPADFFGRTTQISVFNSPEPLKDLSLNILKTLGMFNFAGDYNWRHNLSGAPELFWPVGIIFLIGLAIAIRYIIQNTRYLILISWLIVAALPVIVSNEGLPHALRAILMIPPVFILAGVGGVAIYNFFNIRSQNSYVLRYVLKITSLAFLLYILLTTYYLYFYRWAKNPNTAGAFAADYAEIGRQLNSLPPEQPKYVIVNAGGVDVRGIPMPAQTVMFITDTFTEGKRVKKNIYYLTPNQLNQTEIPKSAYVVEIN